MQLSNSDLPSFTLVIIYISKSVPYFFTMSCVSRQTHSDIFRQRRHWGTLGHKYIFVKGGHIGEVEYIEAQLRKVGTWER